MPWFKFYPSDWLGTGLLRLAPHAVKGFYIDLLCIMFDCENRGRLEAGGMPLTEEEIAGSINGNPTDNLSHLRWLVAKGVLSKDEKGVIYSRRMVKDETRRKAGSEAGKKGGGNPDLAKSNADSQTYIGKSKGNREKPIYLEARDQKLDTRDQILEGRNQNPDKTPKPPRGDFAVEVREVFDHYRTYHAKSHPQPSSASKEWRAIVGRLSEGYSVQDLKEAIDGCHKTPWNCGENPGGKIYQSLLLIVRDSSQVSRFLEFARAGPAPVLSEKTQRTGRAAQQYLQMKGFKNHELDG